MRSRRKVVLALLTFVFASAAIAAPAPKATRIVPVVKTDAEWRRLLTPEQYRVLRTEGTEIAFTGKYWNQHARGTFVCAGCGLELFSSKTKYDSGTGWPSYWQPIAKQNVREVPESKFGQVYSEVECARCGGHLGHVFDDGPKPTGLRYCINSAALSFIPAP
jgi:peptide-methionine (R)-S-oxide reductase